MAVKLENVKLLMRRVYYDPSLQLKVSQCSKLDKQGIKVTFMNTECLPSDVQDRNNLVRTTRKQKKDALFITRIKHPIKRAQVSIASSRAGQNQYQAARNVLEQLWHQRLGHVNQDTVKEMILDLTYWMKA